MSIRPAAGRHIYKNNIFLTEKALACPEKAHAVQFLIQPFHFLGFEGQIWMLIVVALIAGFALLGLRTRDRG